MSNLLTGICCELFVEDARANEGVANGVRIAVAARSSVLEIALLVLGDAARNSYADVPVGDSGAEIVNAAGLAFSG